VYDRTYQNKTLSFEPSGGLLNASLVMADRETDTFWSIMTGTAIAGKLKGTPLRELSVAQKMKWKDWVSRYPNTLVLSINGREDVGRNPYARYFSSGKGYRGMEAKDRRLKTKEPVFAFTWKGRKYAVPHKKIRNGVSFQLDNAYIFLYRPRKARMFASTVAYVSRSSTFLLENGKWKHEGSGCVFAPDVGEFQGSQACPDRLKGFDTFWYIWSLTHPDTQILQ